MEVVNLTDAFSRFTDHWSPNINHGGGAFNTGNVVNERTVAIPERL